MKDIDKISKLLKKENLPKTDFVQFMENIKDPYIVLIACILSLRTNDKTTYPATMRMLALGKTPKDFANLDTEILAKAIYPVGFYKTKAKQIVDLSKILYEEMNSQVPESIEELIKFKGVGRKTANLVLAKGFNKPAICVDVHVHRISNRVGLVKTKNPEETEFDLKKNLPHKYWIDLNTLLVTFGQNICKPISPKCPSCCLKTMCDFYRSSL
ncbi:MAG: endonuclease III [Candidatus Gastranaerophilales bacterium]|nr:endonuclease III [Candidatus Gastranaerophilales bacterium]